MSAGKDSGKFDDRRTMRFVAVRVKQVLRCAQNDNQKNKCKGKGKVKSLELGELGEVSGPDVAAEGEIGAPAFALDVDETGVGQLFEVVGDGGRADDLLLGDRATGCDFVAGDLLKDGEAARIGKGACDGLRLLVGETFAGLCHDC
jgi:hypothetical protein